MDPWKMAINSFILKPRYTEYLALIKAARNGAVYGAKVRFPHALVMVFLFRSGSWKEKLKIIFKATRTHARNLATFAVIYKTIVLLIRHAPPSGKEASYDTFLAGLIGGYIVFGRNSQSSVNQQIVTYVFARVVLALAKMSVQKGGLVPVQLREQVIRNAWPMFAAVSWGTVMWLFRWFPETVQPSMRSSMQYIYTNADHWNGFRDFLIHNT
ncbi:hypothetical protein MMC34_008272 [Xylographa carneopallida]|nr:hypothetical protein [Xylographa carneopallida]